MCGAASQTVAFSFSIDQYAPPQLKLITLHNVYYRGDIQATGVREHEIYLDNLHDGRQSLCGGS